MSYHLLLALYKYEKEINEYFQKNLVASGSNLLKLLFNSYKYPVIYSTVKW